jgi:dipeptidyl aminopeptidase/acylaminoacyl peptidase
MFNIVIPLRGEDDKMSGQRLEGGELYKPTITDMISIEVPNLNVQPRVSHDGRRIAYAVRATNWNKNHYESFCHVYDERLGRSFQLTRSGNVKQMRWIDCDTLALLKEDSSEEEAKPQVWFFESLVGEGLQITDHESGVQSFEPFAGGILFLAEDPERKKRKARSEEFGSFTHFEQEESVSALYYVNVQKMKSYKDMAKRKTEDEAKKLVKPVVELSKMLGEPLKIVDFVCSPLHDAVYLNCRSKDYLVYSEETSVYRLSLKPDEVLEEFMERERTKEEGRKVAPEGSAEDYSYMGELTRLSLPKGASIASVSPDGNKLLVRHQERDNMFYTLSDLWILDLKKVEDVLENEDLGTYMKKITQNLDREPSTVTWVESGIYVGYVDGTKTRIAELAESGDMMVLDLKGISPMFSFHISEGDFIAFIGSNNESFWEVYASNGPLSSPDWELRQLTSFGKGIEGWDLGTVETVRWVSRDGAEIEGVLRKPTDFDPDKSYPLAFVVHGGPRWFDGEFLLEGGDLTYYPVVQFVNKGILVLKPNYRGSIGRGQEFTELNKDNLGVGDLWDLESAIEHLDSQGLVDRSRVGCMGWSQGGYISAFAGIRSDRFRAVSVGAGIADWYTYHVTNDIPQFTTHYLSGSPFDSRDLYAKTAPISGIKEARTPMLIQHGAKDQRVPLASATELYRGLKQMNVPVELFVYPEMAHPITKPRENRAIMHQNLTWFSHHLLGEELDFHINTTKTRTNIATS